MRPIQKEDCAILAMGTILIVLGAKTFYKIYKGSKVPFAYSMLKYTFLYGLVFIIISTIDLMSWN